jgi:hypothetical protein
VGRDEYVLIPTTAVVEATPSAASPNAKPRSRRRCPVELSP